MDNRKDEIEGRRGGRVERDWNRDGCWEQKPSNIKWNTLVIKVK